MLQFITIGVSKIGGAVHGGVHVLYYPLNFHFIAWRILQIQELREMRFTSPGTGSHLLFWLLPSQSMASLAWSLLIPVSAPTYIHLLLSALVVMVWRQGAVNQNHKHRTWIQPWICLHKGLHFGDLLIRCMFKLGTAVMQRFTYRIKWRRLLYCSW